MKKLLKLTVLIAVLIVGFVSVPTLVNAHDGENHEAETTDEIPAEIVSYVYTTQKGDSYTVLARKAVQTYGIIHNVNLSGAQIIYAETNLKDEAGRPSVDIGEIVAFKEDNIKIWVENAQKLSDSDQKPWAKFVKLVNFDTRKNGEA